MENRMRKAKNKGSRSAVWLRVATNAVLPHPIEVGRATSSDWPCGSCCHLESAAASLSAAPKKSGLREFAKREDKGIYFAFR